MRLIKRRKTKKQKKENHPLFFKKIERAIGR
jgi:hypothetical protein